MKLNNFLVKEELAISAYGTSEGVSKGWETRQRGGQSRQEHFGNDPNGRTTWLIRRPSDGAVIDTDNLSPREILEYVSTGNVPDDYMDTRGFLKHFFRK